MNIRIWTSEYPSQYGIGRGHFTIVQFGFLVGLAKRGKGGQISTIVSLPVGFLNQSFASL